MGRQRDCPAHLRVVQLDEKFEPAPLEESLEWARFMLERLQGTTLHRMERVDVQECPQCEGLMPLIRYGNVLLCRRCVGNRLRREDGERHRR
jgi:hypothetical protein